MTNRVFLVVLSWTYLCALFYANAGATSPHSPTPAAEAAANSSPASAELCDLHLWYLDLLADGVFDGPESPKQSSVKQRIDKLMARARGNPSAGKISCTTLSTLESMLVAGAGLSENSGTGAQSAAGHGRGEGDEAGGGDGEGGGRDARDGGHHDDEDHRGGDVVVDGARSHRLEEEEEDEEVSSGKAEGEDGSYCERAESKTASGEEREDADDSDATDDTDIADDDVPHDYNDHDKEGSQETTLYLYDIAEDETEAETTVIESSSLEHDSFSRSVKTRVKQRFHVFLPVCQRNNRKCYLSQYVYPTLCQQGKGDENPPALNMLDYCKTPVETHGRRGRRRKVRGYSSNVHCYYYCIMGAVKKTSDSGVDRAPPLREIQRVCGFGRTCCSLCYHVGHFQRVCLQYYHDLRHSESAPDEGDASAVNDRDKKDDTETPDNETTGSDSAELDENEIHEENENRDSNTEPADMPDDSVEDKENDLNDKEALKTNRGNDETDRDGSPYKSELEVNANAKKKSHGKEKFTDLIDDVEMQKHPKTLKTDGKLTNDERSYNTESDELKRVGLSDEKLRTIDEKYQQKMSEQTVKLQSLELLIMKLENQILSQKLDDHNSTSHIVYLENQILRIENELLRLNQSHATLHEENQILKSRQNKYLAIDHKAQEEKNNRPALPSNSSQYFELVTVQQQKLGLLSELLRNQSSALHVLQQRSDQLEEQNQILHQIIMNQTTLVSHVMQKLMEVSEQNMKNQQNMNQLKSVVDAHSASRDIIHKIENMLEVASDKGTPVLQESGSRTTASEPSSILRFVSIPEFFEETKHWICARNGRPQFCLNFIILVSPCPPFKALTWCHCPYVLREVELVPEQGSQMHTIVMNNRDVLSDKGASSQTVNTGIQGVSETAQIPSISPASPSETTAFGINEKDRANSDKRASEPIESAAPREVSADDGNEAETGESSRQPEKHVTLDEKYASPVYEDKKPKTDSKDSNRRSQHGKILPEGADARDDVNPAQEETPRSTKSGSPKQEETIELWTSDRKPLRVVDETKPAKDASAEQRESDEKSQKGEKDADVKKREAEKQKEGEERMKEEEAVREKQKKEAHVKKLRLQAEADQLKRAEAEKKKKEEEAMVKKKQEAEAAKKKQEEELMAVKVKEAETRLLPYWSADRRKPEDCYEVYVRGGAAQARNGAYKVFVKGLKLYVTVYCDMKAGGWTVIMKREDGSVDFYKGWSDYVNGFGTPFSEHYSGNEVIHYLTNQNQYILQVDLKDWKGNTRTATYQHFWIDDENENFRLHVLGYSGTAGDGLGKHDGMAFSTHDRDNDLLPANQLGGSCARRFNGAGWYYKCYMSNLMGVHYVDGTVPEKKFDGVAWKPWTGPNYSLKEVVMKIKPRTAG